MKIRTRTTILSAAALALLLGACDDASETMDTPETPAPAAAPEAPADPAAGAEMSGLVNPNEAAEAELLAIPGMTEEIVAAVVAGRPWSDMLAVDAALSSFLDEAAREEVYRSVFIPLELNTATEAEILLIPGVGDRMAHEFEEYRPYEAIERFRVEIGKYVEEAEVARLEKYVRIDG